MNHFLWLVLKSNIFLSFLTCDIHFSIIYHLYGVVVTFSSEVNFFFNKLVKRSFDGNFATRKRFRQLFRCYVVIWCKMLYQEFFLSEMSKVFFVYMMIFFFAKLLLTKRISDQTAYTTSLWSHFLSFFGRSLVVKMVLYL